MDSPTSFDRPAIDLHASAVAPEVAIRVRDLGKCYQIYDKPLDRLLQGIFKRRKFYRDFWALRDVDFEIRRGETFGIVGRNGSGKSTLLQLICGTLMPTAGSVHVHGKVGALLELGAGFNPEFTGRENVYMNGTIMGLSKPAIDAKFDEITRFADIGEFIEQPVKTYSSGMFVRLAFASTIAADPEILVVDEALSVGDLAFQNKCMARIRQLSNRGTTIVFVSHDLSTSQVICHRALWLDAGRVAAIGAPVQVCRDYYVASLGDAGRGIEPSQVVAQQETGLARFERVEVGGYSSGEPRYHVGDRVTIQFELHALASLEPSVMAVSIYRSDGDWLVGQSSREAKILWPAAPAGSSVRGEIALPHLALAPGDYSIALASYSEDLTICYAMTGILPGFSVNATFPTWGKLLHAIEWMPQTS